MIYGRVGVLSILFGWFGFSQFAPGFFLKKNPRQIFKNFFVSDARKRGAELGLSPFREWPDLAVPTAYFPRRLPHHFRFSHLCPIRCVPPHWHPY